jgi:cell division protein FtsL
MLALLVAVLGMGRVWLSVMAAEASLDANALRQEIKNLRYEGDMLEVRQSALGSPSRILAIAGATMDMAKAEDVTYIDLPAETFASAKTQDRPVSDAGRDWLGVALDLAAGEAQILLVGDVGLASAR